MKIIYIYKCCVCDEGSYRHTYTPMHDKVRPDLYICKVIYSEHVEKKWTSYIGNSHIHICLLINTMIPVSRVYTKFPSSHAASEIRYQHLLVVYDKVLLAVQNKNRLQWVLQGFFYELKWTFLKLRKVDLFLA